MRRSFLEFMGLRENIEAKKAQSEVKLSDDTDYKPFIVDSEHHPNLRIIAKAFLEGDKVNLPGPDGYPQKLTTLDPTKGEVSPKLKKKTLYLVGGAVRDHLRGKTPKNYDLVTDAHPDEIRLMLRSAKFMEVKPQTDKNTPIDKKYEKHPEAGEKSKIFYAQGWDRGGKEYVIHARVNGEEFEIATFRKDAKGGDGKTPDKIEFAGLDEDSQRRDTTINAMYIPITTADGPNTKLIDPHGGAHHLRAGQVEFVGNPKYRLGEDQLRAMRYIRQIASYGKNTVINDDTKKAIENIKDLSSVSRERIREEFLKGLKDEDVDAVHYIKLYKQLGLLETIFPDLNFKLDVPEDYSDKKEKRLAIAWLLRNNPPEKVRNILTQGMWTKDEVNQITHLIELANWMGSHGKSPEMFFNKFYDMKANFHQTPGMVPSLAKEWGRMNKLPEDLTNKFINHEVEGGPAKMTKVGPIERNTETDKFRKSLQK